MYKSIPNESSHVFIYTSNILYVIISTAYVNANCFPWWKNHVLLILFLIFLFTPYPVIFLLPECVHLFYVNIWLICYFMPWRVFVTESYQQHCTFLSFGSLCSLLIDMVVLSGFDQCIHWFVSMDYSYFTLLAYILAPAMDSGYDSWIDLNNIHTNSQFCILSHSSVCYIRYT